MLSDQQIIPDHAKSSVGPNANKAENVLIIFEQMF